MPTRITKVSQIQALSIALDNLTQYELLEQYDQGILFTPNIDHLVKLQRNEAFYKAYKQARFRVCDSRILQLLSPLVLGKKITQQIAGSDFLPAFCDYHKDNTSIRLFLLGGSEGSDVEAARRLNLKAEREIVVGHYSPPFGFEKDEEENDMIRKMIHDSGATVLVIGVGAPKQELWITTHSSKLPKIKQFMAVGKTIDFIAGETQRAPKWISRIGMEWFYRMVQEPQRLVKRYLVDDLPFFYWAITQRLGMYKHPWED